MIGSTSNDIDGPQTQSPVAHERDERLYIFVADGMNIGGIETLLIRMANQIADLGYRVMIVAQNGPCLESVGNKVVTFELVAGQSLFSQLMKMPLKHVTEDTKVLFWAATPYNLVSIYKYQRHLNKKYRAESVAVSGIFGPARPIQGLRRRYDMLDHLFVLGWLPKGSVYFMSEVVQETYVKQFGNYFRKWPIHKLALGRPSIEWRPRERDVLKVVSIGRITEFKPYNFGALDVVEAMIKRRIPISWDIWGHGDQSELLQRAIHERGLTSYIRFRGELPYSQFQKVASEADLFVGMGTAALEAADMGVPTLVALTWSRLGTYGFLDQCPADSIGERVSGEAESNLIDVIASYSACSTIERLEIGLRCRQAVSLKTSDNPPPFNAVFEGGVEYPSNLSTGVRMKTFGLAQNVWVAVKFLVNLGKSLKRSLSGVAEAG